MVRGGIFWQFAPLVKLLENKRSERMKFWPLEHIPDHQLMRLASKVLKHQAQAGGCKLGEKTFVILLILRWSWMISHACSELQLWRFVICAHFAPASRVKCWCSWCWEWWYAVISSGVHNLLLPHFKPNKTTKLSFSFTLIFMAVALYNIAKLVLIDLNLIQHICLQNMY